MSFAIKRLNGDIIWFDAVSSYSESYSGQATKHPVEDGSNISDFFIKNNPSFSLEAVISDADFNIDRVKVDGNWINNQPVESTNSVAIRSSVTNPLLSILPENISGLLQLDEEVTATVITRRRELILTIKNTLKTIHDKGEPFTLLSFRGTKEFDPPVNNCLLTSLTFSESPDTGDALYPSMTIEKVNVVTIRRGTTPKFRAINILGDATSGLQKTAGGAGKSVQSDLSPTAFEDATKPDIYKSELLKLTQGLGIVQ